MKSLVPNTLLQNRYLVVHLIGKGGMGDVYLAVDQRLGSAVALKRTFFSDDEMLGNAFEREAKTLARLRHPVLPKVSDHFTENEEQYLVMEHISGEDLSKRLESMNKSFPLSWVLFWADQLLDALAYLHSHEPPIIHRDIKPQNLKLTDDNHIILLDFGLSKNNAGETKTMNSGSTASVVGYTPHYAPMEQIRGTGTNPRSDLYALSATLYQLMTNSVPSDALTRADALLNDMSDPIKAVSDLNPEIPRAVSDVILKGMAISQDKRFSTAREMQKALREAFANIQNAMSAQTVAFNVQSEQIALENKPISLSSEKTEVLTAEQMENIAAIPVQTPVALNTGSLAKSEETPNFEATLQMDAPSSSDSVKQSNVQTEVFLAGASPAISAAQDGEYSLKENNTPNENFAPTENFSASEVFGKKTEAENFSPGATIPFNGGNNDESLSAPSDSMIFTNPNIETNSDAFATVTTSANEQQEEKSFAAAANFNSKSPQTAPVVKKKSGGKVLGVIAGLGALLLLLVGGAIGGWYYYQNVYLPGLVTENPSPTPAPSLEVTPTPEVTPEIVNNTNSSTNSNTQLSGLDSNTQIGGLDNTNANAIVTDKNPDTNPTPPKENIPRPTPLIIKPNPNPTPNKPASTPIPKPTAKTLKTPIGVQ